MAAKLSDEEFAARMRAGNRRRSERYRNRLSRNGKAALTLWVSATVRDALTAEAAERGDTVSDTANALLAGALGVAESEQARFDSRPG